MGDSIAITNGSTNVNGNHSKVDGDGKDNKAILTPDEDVVATTILNGSDRHHGSNGSTTGVVETSENHSENSLDDINDVDKKKVLRHLVESLSFTTYDDMIAIIDVTATDVEALPTNATTNADENAETLEADNPALESVDTKVDLIQQATNNQNDKLVVNGDKEQTKTATNSATDEKSLPVETTTRPPESATFKSKELNGASAQSTTRKFRSPTKQISLDEYYDLLIRRPTILVQRILKFQLTSLVVTLIWLVYRIRTAEINNSDINATVMIRSSGSSTNSSILQTVCQLFIGIEQVLLFFIERAVSPQHEYIYQWVLTLISTLLQDILGYFILHQIYLTIYQVTHFYNTKFVYETIVGNDNNESVRKIKDDLFQMIINHIPPIQTKIEDEAEKFRVESMPSILGKDPDRVILNAIPEKPRSADEIIKELSNYASVENNHTFRGQVSGTVYGTNDSQHHLLMKEVYGLYSYSNPLHPGYWPKLNQCESEVIAMVGSALHAPASPAVGCITSGGTESIILSIRAHAIYYGCHRGIQHPEIICLSTAHAALDKACEMFSIKKVVIEASEPNGFQLRASDVRKHLSCNTIMIYSSAPCFPHGVIDPIEDLSQVAVQYNIGLHVDACLGGFVLAFANEETNKPKFDFTNKGVSSISIDTHKYGYSTKGTSVILYRFRKLRHCQYFSYPRWTGGLYHTPTISGSRPGGLSACAWASLVSIGQVGFEQRSSAIIAAARKIGIAIQESIPQLKLFVTDPSKELFVVVSMKSDDPSALNIYEVQDIMKNSYGWGMNSLQYPAAIHICITLSIVPRTDELIANLKATVDQIVATPRGKKSSKSSGAAGIYGTVSSAPAGPIHHLLNVFADEVLTP